MLFQKSQTSLGRFMDGPFSGFRISYPKKIPERSELRDFFFAGSSQRLPICIARHWASVRGLRRAIVAPFSPAIGWTAKHSPLD